MLEVLLLFAVPTLLVSLEEKQMLETAKKAYLAEHRALVDPDALFLKAIIYIAKDRWVVWLNEYKVTPQETFITTSNNKQIHFTKIDPDKIHLTYSNKNVILHPNQSYSPHTNKVINGDIRTNP